MNYIYSDLIGLRTKCTGCFHFVGQWDMLYVTASDVVYVFGIVSNADEDRSWTPGRSRGRGKGFVLVILVMSAVDHAAFFFFFFLVPRLLLFCLRMLCGRDEWWWCYIIMWLSLSLLLTALWQAHTEKHAHTLGDLCQERAWFINCWNPRWRVPTQSIGSAATAWSSLGSCDVDKKRHTNTHICTTGLQSVLHYFIDGKWIQSSGLLPVRGGGDKLSSRLSEASLLPCLILNLRNCDRILQRH